MPRKKEVSFDPALFPALYTIKQGERDRSKSELQALMEAAPGSDPDPSQEALYPLREIIQDALEGSLDERQVWIFNALVVEKLSLRQVASMLNLSKSQVARIHEQSLATLRERLGDLPIIQEHLSD